MLRKFDLNKYDAAVETLSVYIFISFSFGS